MTIVVKSDIELFLCGEIRDRLADVAVARPDLAPLLTGFQVTNREPTVDMADFPARLIIVRLDSDTDTDMITSDAAVGVNVLMGDVTNVLDSGQVARIVHGIVRNCARNEAGNPVAVVSDSNGPYLVQEDQPRARYYSTHTLGTVGAALY